MFALVLGVYEVLQQEPPVWHAPKIATPASEEEKKKDAHRIIAPTWERIYQEDIFGTYTAKDLKAVKQSLITPIPEPRPPVIPPPPEPQKQEIIPALSIFVRGIIAGGDENRNVAMITDETNKEGMYHLGEKIKDAQIIKIAHNRVVFLRANGQQEVFYLRKDDAPTDQPAAEKWQYIVKKIDDQTYEVDPISFTKEVDTLGSFIEKISVIGAAYHGGQSIGIRIGKVEQSEVATALGLMENDIITTVNELPVADAKNRLAAYEKISAMQIGGDISVGIKRADKDVIVTYRLAQIPKPKKSIFPGIKVAAPSTLPAEDPLKLSRLQQREQSLRDFDKLHPEQQRHEQTMMEIRKRILDNLQRRLHNTRTR
jgi:type II secretory pathway component PulC